MELNQETAKPGEEITQDVESLQLDTDIVLPGLDGLLLHLSVESLHDVAHQALQQRHGSLPGNYKVKHLLKIWCFWIKFSSKWGNLVKSLKKKG